MKIQLHSHIGTDLVTVESVDIIDDVTGEELHTGLSPLRARMVLRDNPQYSVVKVFYPHPVVDSIRKEVQNG